MIFMVFLLPLLLSPSKKILPHSYHLSSRQLRIDLLASVESNMPRGKALSQVNYLRFLAPHIPDRLETLEPLQIELFRIFLQKKRVLCFFGSNVVTQQSGQTQPKRPNYRQTLESVCRHKTSDIENQLR